MMTTAVAHKVSSTVKAALIAVALATAAVAATQAYNDETYYCGDDNCNLNNPLVGCDPANNVCPSNPGGYYTKCCKITDI